MNFLQYLNPFRKPTPQQMRAVLIDEAERLAIEHAMNAEKCIADAKNHATMRAMYEARATRLRKANRHGA